MKTKIEMTSALKSIITIATEALTDNEIQMKLKLRGIFAISKDAGFIRHKGVMWCDSCRREVANEEIDNIFLVSDTNASEIHRQCGFVCREIPHINQGWVCPICDGGPGNNCQCTCDFK